MRAATLVALALAGCYHPTLEPCTVVCGPGGACPEGTTCLLADMHCHPEGDVTTCSSGAGGGGTAACDNPPTAEVCDGRDNDCDGVVDRFADGGALRDNNPCQRFLGVCSGATHACVAGVFEATCSSASYGPRYQ